MEIVKARAFLAAVEGGSLTSAARVLCCTQPGATRMINSLEEELGFPLLVRTKRGVSPTPNGLQMLPLLKDLVRAHRLCEETGASISGAVSGTLAIGCYWSVSAMILPGVLKAFLRDHPGVRVTLREGTNAELSRMLAERSVDLCFSARPSGGDFDWLPVQDDELVAWLPWDHPDAGLERFPLAKLADYPFIVTQPGRDTDIDRLLERAGIIPDVRFATLDGWSTWKMVEAGLGISLNQRLISRDWTGRVRTVPFDPPQHVRLGIALPSLKDASPAARRLLGCLPCGQGRA